MKVLNTIEIWKDVIGFEGYYQVSDSGKIRGLDRIDTLGRKVKGKILSVRTDKDGYLLVTLVKNNNAKTKKVHRVVAESFLQNPNNLPEVNHIDGDKRNNSVKNLEWCTHKENHVHARKTGLIQQKGEKSVNHKLTTDAVHFIREMYKRGDSVYGCCALANKFNVSQATISRVVKGKRWKE